jgi:hypothetical protein
MDIKKLISESEIKRILNLYENVKNIVGTQKTYIIEQDENINQEISVDSDEKIILGSKNDDWDYKKSGNNYFAKRKGTENWLLAKGNARISIATKIFGDEASSEDIKVDQPIKLKSYFLNTSQGNKFREWVNKYYKGISKKYDLSLTGPYDNTNIKQVANTKIESDSYGQINLGDLFLKQNKWAEYTSEEPGKTLPSLVKTGFKVNKATWKEDHGYFINKCTQEGCAAYTYEMIGQKFGDAWQAYGSFNVAVPITASQRETMTTLFNSINQTGSPSLNAETDNDATAKNFLQSLIPQQSNFKNLKLGTVVGLFYPDSKNYDLAFFQSAIGKQRMGDGSWYTLRPPYFCSDYTKCSETLWKPSDLKSKKKFVAGYTLRKGISFPPTTHIGFIGYVDEDGVPYVVHNVHKNVYAFPVTKMNKSTLSIVWAGDPNTIK